jgi:hypothetical protein
LFSRGQLANIIAKVREALERPHEQLLKDLPDQDRLNVDETRTWRIKRCGSWWSIVWSLGARSDKGNRWCERIWTVIATCTQQGRSVFEYLEAAIMAWFVDTESPTLLSGIWASETVGGVLGCKVRKDRGILRAVGRRQHRRREQ